jgi:hypothetical protein
MITHSGTMISRVSREYLAAVMTSLNERLHRWLRYTSPLYCYDVTSHLIWYRLYRSLNSERRITFCGRSQVTHLGTALVHRLYFGGPYHLRSNTCREEMTNGDHGRHEPGFH